MMTTDRMRIPAESLIRQEGRHDADAPALLLVGPSNVEGGTVPISRRIAAAWAGAKSVIVLDVIGYDPDTPPGGLAIYGKTIPQACLDHIAAHADGVGAVILHHVRDEETLVVFNAVAAMGLPVIGTVPAVSVEAAAAYLAHFGDVPARCEASMVPAADEAAST